VPEKTDDFPDDLTTRRPLIRLTGNAEELAGNISQSVVRHLRDPENVAALSGAILMPLIVFRGRRVPFLPLFLVSLMGEQAGRMVYRSSENLRIIAQAAMGQVPEVSCTDGEPGCPPGETVREHWEHGGRLNDLPDS
jgi:hypothetical protein